MFENELKSGYVLRTQGTPVEDGQGGYTTTPSNVSFNGVIRLLGASDRTLNSRDGVRSTHRIYAKPGLVITDSSQIVFESNVYKIVYVNNVMREDELLQIDVVLND